MGYRLVGVAVLLAANALILLAVLLQSYNGRVDLINANRHACQQRAHDLARIANIDRDQQQLDVHLVSVIRSPGLQKLLTTVAAHENRDLHALDRHLDPAGWGDLNPIGLTYVESLRHPYSCSRTFPGATFRIVSSR